MTTQNYDTSQPLTPRSKKYRRKRKSHRIKKSKLDQFLNSKLLIVIGSVFLLIGLIYSFTAPKGENRFQQLLLNFFSPSENTYIFVGTSGLGMDITLYLYFLPAVTALVISIFYSRRFSSITFPVIIVASVYLLCMQVLITLLAQYGGGSFYPNFGIASLFLLLPVVLLLISAFFHRRSVILILAIAHFYVSILLYTVNFGVYLNYLLTFILIFTLSIFWVSNKAKKPSINLINFIFATGYIALYWLKKFVINSKSDYLNEFFTFSILSYFLFSLVVILASNTKEYALRRWMQFVMILTNVLFLTGASSYIFVKFYAVGYLWLYILSILLVNLLTLFWLIKLNWKGWSVPFYYSVILLAALVLPALVKQDRILFFASVFSLLMLYYACHCKDRPAIWVSMGSLTVMFVYYLILWAFSYLPAILSAEIPEGTLLLNGILNGMTVIGILYAIQEYLKNAEIPLSRKWFSRSAYRRIVRGALFFSMFFTFGWIVFSVVSQLNTSTVFTTVSWFISGAVFFISGISFYSGKQSVFKKPLLYIALLFVFLYPVLVQWSLIDFSERLIYSGSAINAGILLHFTALILLLILGFMTVSRIYKRNVKNIPWQNAIKTVTVCFLGFLICTEFDILILLFRAMESNTSGIIQPELNLTFTGKYLPWSILLWVLAVVIFIRSVIYNDVFLRTLSLILFLLVLIKIFAFDFSTLSQGGRSVLFILIGLFLIAFAIFYQRIQKLSVLQGEKRNHSSEDNTNRK